MKIVNAFPQSQTILSQSLDPDLKYGRLSYYTATYRGRRNAEFSNYDRPPTTTKVRSWRGTRCWIDRRPLQLKFKWWEWLLLVWLLVMVLCFEMSDECPIACECKWKNGKESVTCANPKIKLSAVPQGLDPGTQMLDLSGNFIKNLPPNVFLDHNLLNLQKIFLSNCNLKVMDKDVFLKLINLVELDLSQNVLDFVPSHTFDQITELRELKLSSNPILKIQNKAFTALPHLIRLELSGCRIRIIEPNAFQGMSALEWLYLDNNQLSTVQATSFYPLKSLHGLEFHKNQWNCSCALQPLRDWMKNNNVPFGVPPVCSDPPKLVGKFWDELQLEDFACVPKVQSSPMGSSTLSKVFEGNNASLLCRLQATPDTKVRWWNGNKPIVITTNGPTPSQYQLSESFSWEPGDTEGSSLSDKSTAMVKSSFKGMTLGTKTSRLTFLRTKLKDSGTYSCRAESRAGSVSANFTLLVIQNKAEHLSGRLLLYGAAVAALLTLSVCLLLLCVVFACGRKGYSATRIIAEDKFELNHIGAHPPGQNGGGRVPLLPSNHHNNNHNNTNALLNGHNLLLNNYNNSSSNASSNNIGGMRNNKRVGNNNGHGGNNIESSLNASNYKPLSTIDPDDLSENDDNYSEDEKDGNLGGVNNEVVIAGRKRLQRGRLRSSKSDVNPASSSEVKSPTSQALLKPEEPVRKPPPVRPRVPKIGQNDALESQGRSSSVKEVEKPKREKYPDLIDGNNIEFSSLPRTKEAENVSMMSVSNPPKQNHQIPQNRQNQDSNPSPGNYFHRRVNSDSQSPLIPLTHQITGSNSGYSGDQMTSSGYSILSTSSNDSPYGSTSTNHTHLTSSNRTLANSGKFSYHHLFKYQQAQQPHDKSNPNQFKFKTPGFYPYHQHQRRSMPTSPVHHEQQSYGNAGGYSYKNPYGDAPAQGTLKHHNSHDGSTVPIHGQTHSISNLGSNVTRTGSDPVQQQHGQSDCEYDYHAAQLAAFLEEYRVLQMELMRMSASLQQVNDIEVNPTGSSNSNNSNVSNNVNSTNHNKIPIPSVITVGSGVNNANANQIPGESRYLMQKIQNPNLQNLNPSVQKEQQLQQLQQLQLKSILKNSGNNNNYVA